MYRKFGEGPLKKKSKLDYNDMMTIAKNKNNDMFDDLDDDLFSGENLEDIEMFATQCETQEAEKSSKKSKESQKIEELLNKVKVLEKEKGQKEGETLFLRDRIRELEKKCSRAQLERSESEKKAENRREELKQELKSTVEKYEDQLRFNKKDLDEANSRLKSLSQMQKGSGNGNVSHSYSNGVDKALVLLSPSRNRSKVKLKKPVTPKLSEGSFFWNGVEDRMVMNIRPGVEKEARHEPNFLPGFAAVSLNQPAMKLDRDFNFLPCWPGSNEFLKTKANNILCNFQQLCIKLLKKHETKSLSFLINAKDASVRLQHQIQTVDFGSYDRAEDKRVKNSNKKNSLEILSTFAPILDLLKEDTEFEKEDSASVLLCLLQVLDVLYQVTYELPEEICKTYSGLLSKLSVALMSSAIIKQHFCRIVLNTLAAVDFKFYHIFVDLFSQMPVPFSSLFVDICSELIDDESTAKQLFKTEYSGFTLFEALEQSYEYTDEESKKPPGDTFVNFTTGCEAPTKKKDFMLKSLMQFISKMDLLYSNTKSKELATVQPFLLSMTNKIMDNELNHSEMSTRPAEWVVSGITNLVSSFRQNCLTTAASNLFLPLSMLNLVKFIRPCQCADENCPGNQESCDTDHFLVAMRRELIEENAIKFALPGAERCGNSSIKPGISNKAT